MSGAGYALGQGCGSVRGGIRRGPPPGSMAVMTTSPQATGRSRAARNAVVYVAAPFAAHLLLRVLSRLEPLAHGPLQHFGVRLVLVLAVMVALGAAWRTPPADS